MLFESEWSADATAAPLLVTDDPEGEMFTGLGDRTRSLTDLRLNRSGEAPDRCDEPVGSAAVAAPRGTRSRIIEPVWVARAIHHETNERRQVKDTDGQS